MCYFVHVKVTSQHKPADAEAVLERVAKAHKLYLRDLYPHTQVTNGHCSCDYIQQDGHAVYLMAFLEEIIKVDEIKNLEIGWTWSKPMEPNAAVERLTLQDFLARNDAESLSPDVWYKFHDPNKYDFSH